jgi:hypothetical protein
METLSATTETQPRVGFQRHWPEYLMEAAELGLFMISACVFTPCSSTRLLPSAPWCLTPRCGAF